MQTALDYLAGNLTALSQTLTDLVKHGFTFGLATNVVTALPGVPARFPILLENKGTEPTTFDLSVGSLPFDVTATFDQSTITLQPGERIDGSPGDPALNLSFTGSSLFPSGFTVFATPQEAPGLAAQTSGSVAVRSEFVQVATVTPSPAFTEPGGIVAITARILNVVNREQVALVSYRVTDSNGATVFTSADQAVTLGVQSSLIDVTLAGFQTRPASRGAIYTITVSVADATGAPIPGGSGQATLLVGTPVSGTLTVAPDALLSIDSIVTNTLRLDARSVDAQSAHAPRPGADDTDGDDDSRQRRHRLRRRHQRHRHRQYRRSRCPAGRRYVRPGADRAGRLHGCPTPFRRSDHRGDAADFSMRVRLHF